MAGHKTRTRLGSPRAMMLALSTVVLGAAVLSGCSSSGSSSSSTTSTSKPSAATRYYVSLGDSYATGVQPDASGDSIPTNEGYPDVLYNEVRPSMPDLQLVKLGCSGETTTTAIKGGTCHYAEGSQLAAAASFIRSNQSSIAFVTVELGANNFESCVPNGNVDTGCVLDELATVVTELPQIFKQLRDAGGPQMKIVAMNLFDPFLAAWLSGPEGQTLAQASVEVLREFNQTLRSIHRAAGVSTASVAGAFSTYETFSNTTDLPGRGTVPVAVARICQWTWGCAPPPQGPNEHPNAEGYRQIANAFRPLVS
jgi:lysophospholipase L1-like esterase